MQIKKYAEQLNYYRFFVDILMIFLAWITAFFIRFHSGLIEITKGTDTFEHSMRLVPILFIAYALTFSTLGVYKRTLQKRKIWSENFDLLQSHTMGFFVFVTLSFFIFDHIFSRIAIFIFFLINPIFMAIGRSLIRKLSRAYLQKITVFKNAILVGSNNTQSLIDLIHNTKEWNLKVIKSIPLDGQDYALLFKQFDPAVIVVSPTPDEFKELKNFYPALNVTPAEVFLLPSFGEPIFLEHKFFKLDRFQAIALNPSPLVGLAPVLKRLFDIAFAALFILVFSPVFLVCALLVKLSSPGPIFYRQERMGLDGKIFMCLKFRGMYVNAEDKSGPVWAKANDDRTTPIGKILRKTSLDEIPQFFNVLRGEMSVVGPRPERPYFVENFAGQIPGYMLRHKAKAGITGWAQINGWRGNTSLEKRIECDLWYIQNWSFWLDLKIIFLTPFKGLIHPNAY